MFSVGEKVIYGSEGVCTVEKIDNMNISGADKSKKYYYLSPLYRSGMIYAPIDTPVFMRNIITKSEASDLIENIPKVETYIFTDINVRILSEKYQSVIKSYNCIDLVKVIKSIYKKRSIATEKGKKLGSVDERFLEKAENMLLGELSVSLEMPIEEISDILSNKLNNTEL